MQDADILRTNTAGWDAIADEWFGATSLPAYGPNMPTEDALRLFGDVSGKALLDIGCGSGHSLLYHARNGAAQLYGLDMSRRQIENARRLLAAQGVDATLFVSPMEEDPGLPEAFFDFVYSIYALGWTVDLPRTIAHAARCLKSGGHLIFTWDNPLLPCLDDRDGAYFLARSYHDEGIVTLNEGMAGMKFKHWKLSSYVSALADAGFAIERLIEEVDPAILAEEQAYTGRHYAKHKAALLHTSFGIKARKL